MGIGRPRSVRPSLLARLLIRAWFAAWTVLERAFYHGHQYTVLVPYGNRVLTPWFDPHGGSLFADAHRVAAAAGPMAVTADRCYMLHQFAFRSASLPGEMAECGVFTGGTAHLLAEAMSHASPGKTLHLFDSFEGMPEAADPDRDYHAPGDFSNTSLARVQRRLGRYASVRFHPGFVPRTFAELDPDSVFSFVHVDMDIYSSTEDCCRWFWPRLTSGGAMVFDDYGFFHLRLAARAAVDAFFADQADKPIVLPTGQAVVIKH
jgi:predicted O-methyltransferase YrrM